MHIKNSGTDSCCILTVFIWRLSLTQILQCQDFFFALSVRRLPVRFSFVNLLCYLIQNNQKPFRYFLLKYLCTFRFSMFQEHEYNQINCNMYYCKGMQKNSVKQKLLLCPNIPISEGGSNFYELDVLGRRNKFDCSKVES